MTHILLNCVVGCFCLVCVYSQVAMEALLHSKRLPFTYEQFYKVKDDHDLVNSVIDFVMDDLVVRYGSNVTLPDHLWSYAPVGTDIRVSSGRVRGLESLKRVGNLEVDVKRDRMTLSLSGTFEQLIISYDKYKAKFLWLVSSSGRLNIYVPDVLFRATLVMDKKSMCLINIKRLEILRLERMKLEFLSACSFCNQVSNYLSTKLLNVYAESIKNVLQKKIDTSVKEFVMEHRGKKLFCLQENYLEQYRPRIKAQQRPVRMGQGKK